MICVFLLVLLLQQLSFTLNHSANVGFVKASDFSIQEAIKGAREGDTIFVPSGTYYESIVVNKTVSLIGENAGTTIIDGTGFENAISIKADNVKVKGFTIQGSRQLGQTGISIQDSDNNEVSHNVIHNNFYGVRILRSEKSIVSDNNFSSNSFAIYLMSLSNFTSIVRNNIESGYSGVWCEWSNNNTLAGNMIRQCSQYGFWLRKSNSSRIFHNNFIENMHHAWILNSVNSWDNGFEGNYWSNYTGVDGDGDGVGDTSYVIDASNVDNHPLMGISADFEADGYYVRVISNSTVRNFGFNVINQTARSVSFNVSGLGGTGFCRIIVPTALGVAPFTVFVDGGAPLDWKVSHSNPADTTLLVKYQHSEREVTVIMKFQPADNLLLYAVLAALVLCVAIAVVGVVVYRRRKQKVAKR